MFTIERHRRDASTLGPRGARRYNQRFMASGALVGPSRRVAAAKELLTLAGLTAVFSVADAGPADFPIALAIAAVKALAVVGFFKGAEKR
jgi:hypothetical protein